MQKTEFNAFLAHVQALFPSLRSWFEGMAPDDRRDMLLAWSGVFAHVSAEDCRSVVQTILAGEMPRPFPEEFAGVVRVAALKLADARSMERRAADSHNPKFCALCQNTGFVTVWHPLTIRALEENADSYQHPRTGETFVARRDGRVIAATVVVACGCSAGDSASKRRVHGPAGWREVELPRFAGGRYIPARSARPETDWEAAQMPAEV